MKILIIPDVHGRDFWIEPCQHIDEFDKIIFLGDYHDPYTFQVSQETSRHRLRDELVPFIESHKDKVICLFGNHDGNYLVGDMADRCDKLHKREIVALLERMNLQLVYKIDNYLFSHSGVLPEWLNYNGLKIEDLQSMEFTHPALMQVSPNRGGWDRCGSCIWGDVSEYNCSDKIPGIYQIFGHTQLQRDPIITQTFACLDCRKAFVLNTETQELKEYEQARISESN